MLIVRTYWVKALSKAICNSYEVAPLTEAQEAVTCEKYGGVIAVTAKLAGVVTAVAQVPCVAELEFNM